jgi:hypothetical protein
MDGPNILLIVMMSQFLTIFEKEERFNEVKRKTKEERREMEEKML